MSAGGSGGWLTLPPTPPANAKGTVKPAARLSVAPLSHRLRRLSLTIWPDRLARPVPWLKIGAPVRVDVGTGALAGLLRVTPAPGGEASADLRGGGNRIGTGLVLRLPQLVKLLLLPDEGRQANLIPEVDADALDFRLPDWAKLKPSLLTAEARAAQAPKAAPSAPVKAAMTVATGMLPAPQDATWAEVAAWAAHVGVPFDGDMLPVNRAREKRGLPRLILTEMHPPRAAANRVGA